MIYIKILIIVFQVIKLVEFVTLPTEKFVKESINIVSMAEKEGVIIRILGALAVYIHTEKCMHSRRIYNNIPRFGEGKPMFTDLDLMAYSSQRKKIMHFFEKTLGFKSLINPIFSYKRLIYEHPRRYFHVDVFFDKLEFSHDVNFGNKPGKGRLELDFTTITLTDIVLEKIQIHEINLKDIVDLMVIFRCSDISTNFSKDTVDAKYISTILSNDWGFWYDGTNNLIKVKKFAEVFAKEGKITEEDKNVIISRIDGLLKIIDETPKSKKWLKRSKIGTSKPWYRVVEEVER